MSTESKATPTQNQLTSPKIKVTNPTTDGQTPPDASKPASTQTPNPAQSQTDPNLNSLTLDEALKLANTQASIYQQARINEAN
jgi:hypothetical protein